MTHRPALLPTAPDRAGASAMTRADQALVRLGGAGLRLIDGALTGRPTVNQLLVGLRREPAQRRFEPDWILYWVASSGRGVQRRLDRSCLEIGDAPFAWGTIRVFDRLSAFNTFVTFGGTVTVSHASDGTLVAQFTSPAPILRWTGGEPAPDVRAAEAECFFARLMVPIDFTSGAEALVSATRPGALYAAMLADLEPRLAAERALDAPDARLAAAVRRESRRMRDTDASAWQEGGALLDRLGLAGRGPHAVPA